ncbi:MAG: hypothetical protein KDB88_00410, partial [Flavobacteriales bacterium]|nr:hypothetical protein [Flavobacteriales bacterium]
MTNSILSFSAAFMLLQSLLVQGQSTYFGMTSSGGDDDVGVIYSVNESGVFTKRHDFDRFLGSGSQADLMKATNGLYYGVTQFGGANGNGTLFSYNPVTQEFVTLHSFSSSDGTSPLRGLVQANNGRLYGTCNSGGANSFGTIFEYNIATSTFTKRHDFNNTNGRNPVGRMVLAANGRLYGTTLAGGTALPPGGVIFEFNPPNTYTKKLDLSSVATGSNPIAGLYRASNNLLYGVTQNGGTGSAGRLFSYNTTTNALAVLHDFSTTDGKTPQGELVQANNGKLYGTTQTGGATNQGVIFSYDIGTSTFTKEADLGPATGYAPVGRLIKGANGLLYGTALLGGTISAGTLFSFNTGTSVVTKLYDLADGGLSNCRSGLLEDPAGTFVGVTADGGSGGSGALYRYVAASDSYTELVPFGLATGSDARGRLTYHTNGLFYGMTSRGGTGDEGTIFSFDPVTDSHTKLADLGGSLGSFPLGSLVEAGGKFYGLCSAGGASSGGTVIEFDPTTNILTKKLDLNAGTGTTPKASMILAGNGRLYGLTSAGGANGSGTLFDFVPGTNTLTVRADLAVATGTAPEADLMVASNGLLYGTLSENGPFAFGSLFSFDTGSNTMNYLWNFDGLQGGGPAGQLLQASNGKLYGTCKEEGLFFQGCIYSWDINTSTYVQEYDMQPAEGAFSGSGLIQGQDGQLYGTCTEGGSGSTGTVFRWNPGNGVFQVIQDLSGTNGELPFDGLAAVPGSSSDLVLDLKLFLQGPYDQGAGLMNDDLRGLASFPLTEPFTSLGFSHVGGGGESIPASVLSVAGNDAIVDWVFIELRSGGDNTAVVATRSALVQRDGDVVDLDGSSDLSIPGAAGNYFVAVRHRNHLACMTASSVALSTSPTTLDLTNGSVATFGTNAQLNSAGVRLIWSGNTVPDDVVKYAGINNDRDKVLQRIGGSVPTAVVGGYFI